MLESLVNDTCEDGENDIKRVRYPLYRNIVENRSFALLFFTLMRFVNDDKENVLIFFDIL